MQPSSATVTRLLGRLYDAAAAPELWPEFLQDLRLTANADMAYVLAVDSDHGCDLSIQQGFEDSAVAKYQQYFVGKDLILSGFLHAKAQSGDWIGDSQSVIPSEDLRRSEIFNDFMKPNGVAHQCGATLSGLRSGQEAGICMMRSENAGAFEQETIALLAILAPHVKRAVKLHQTLDMARAEASSLRQSIETVGLPVVSVGGNGEILNITQAAQDFLNARDGLAIQGKRLCPTLQSEAQRFSELIAGAVSTGAGSRGCKASRCTSSTAPQARSRLLWTPASGGAMLVSRRRPKRPLQVVVTPFHSSSAFLSGKPSALIFLSDPDAMPASRSSILRQLYGLTPTESRLADLLTAGHELGAAADQLTMTAQTARFHLKSVFRKTGTCRQTGLVRMVLGLPGCV
jgi:DNA-binding CsgD family transcriptional regulator